jgi:hypothetical protein
MAFGYRIDQSRCGGTEPRVHDAVSGILEFRYCPRLASLGSLIPLFSALRPLHGDGMYPYDITQLQ